MQSIERLSRHWRSGLLLVALVLGMASCRFAMPAAPTKELRIGLLLTQTGVRNTTSGPATLEAATMAVDEINAAGGLLVGEQRYRITIIPRDDGDRPEMALESARALINLDRVDLLVGPQVSRNAIPVSVLAEEVQIPMVSPMSTNVKTTEGKDFVFRTAFVDSFQGRAMAHFAYDSLKATRVAMLYDVSNEYNRGLAEIFKTEFEWLGGQIVADEHYTTGAQDFTEALARIKAASPDILFLPNFSEDVIPQATQAREMGLDATILGSDAWNANQLGPIPAIEGAFYTHHWHIASDTPKSQPFVAAYRARYQGKDPIVTSAMTYDTFGLLFDAIQRAGSIEPDAIRDALAKTSDYEGVTGTFTYGGKNDPAKNVLILQFQAGKTVVTESIKP